MSGKKNKGRSKSGLLTGLMIVSTGMIAGFHGFDLVISEQSGEKKYAVKPAKSGNERTSSSITQQVSALDKLVTASLKETKERNDSQGLAGLIRSAQIAEDPNAKVATQQISPTDAYPVVNRAMKRDRAKFSATNTPTSITSFLNPAIQDSLPDVKVPKSLETKKQVFAEGAEKRVREKAPVTSSVNNQANKEIPFTDSADIALFAADMPLPAKLTLIATKSNGVPLLSKGYRTPSTRSPLMPRKFVSGKAFGGLGERAFQKRERRCMTTALYFEARSEPEAGQIAVGQVVMNRVRSPDYPDTICGVVYQGSHRRTGCQFSFTCDGKADKPNNKTQWERSKRLANRVLEGQVWLNSIGHATHYHATYVKPRWRRKMARLKQIGRHIFYKAPKISVTHTYQRYMSGKRG